MWCMTPPCTGSVLLAASLLLDQSPCLWWVSTNLHCWVTPHQWFPVCTSPPWPLYLLYFLRALLHEPKYCPLSLLRWQTPTFSHVPPCVDEARWPSLYPQRKHIYISLRWSKWPRNAMRFTKDQWRVTNRPDFYPEIHSLRPPRHHNLVCLFPELTAGFLWDLNLSS